MLMTRDGPAVIDVKTRYRSKIEIFLPQLGGPRRNTALRFGMENTIGWCGYAMVKQFWISRSLYSSVSYLERR